jgi:hypothetical protein
MGLGKEHAPKNKAKQFTYLLIPPTERIEYANVPMKFK